MTRDIEMQQAEQDILSLLISPDQTHLRCTSDRTADQSAGEVNWQVEAMDVPTATVSYPLNPADSQDWLGALSSHSLLDCWSEAELDERSTAFFGRMDQLWAPDLVAVLSRKFGTVPQEMLSFIALRASQLAKTSVEQVEQASDLAGGLARDLADQLIACTQSILPQWAEDDLRVFARPLVYAMRGDSPKTDIQEKDWASMSDIEQAKLTLAIAKYAMAQAQSEGYQA